MTLNIHANAKKLMLIMTHLEDKVGVLAVSNVKYYPKERGALFVLHN